ncbi:MAG: 2-succinyl-5-enolpyruvyl-6-hydroxy-3-cyclohexene-1-carboxylic-acid synthase [Myxococcota bacterium]
MGTPADLQSEWARLVIGGLVCAGVRHVVISPGSRSTPFVVAALQRDDVDAIAAFDERSAAHFALGQARATGRPSLLICTSGSAPANYFPAVVEAYEAGVPLVVLSADRPPELHGCGANQTTDQIQLYGSHVRFFANLGEPRGDDASLRSLHETLRQAVHAATDTIAGPVHLNAQARKPLEPQVATDRESAAVHQRVTTLLDTAAAVETPSPKMASDVDLVVASALDLAERPLILCGPGPIDQGTASASLASLAEHAGAVVLAEAGSQFRFGAAGAAALGAFDTVWATEAGRAALNPDVVLQLGQTPISSAWGMVKDTVARRIVVHGAEWVDASPSATTFARTDVASLVRRLAARDYARDRRDPSFAPRAGSLDRTAWGVATQLLDSAGDALSEPAAALALVDAMPDDAALVLGNSLPVRDVDRWVAPSTKPLRVFVQRGVSGIDGLISAAAGTASQESGPTALLVGDISFLHDLNGLALAAASDTPLVVVVVNNGGGRIFEQLPIAGQGNERWLPYFTTPQQADLRGAALLYGCAFEAVSTVSALRSALPQALRQPGCTVIEARVPPHSAKELGDELRRRVAEALAGAS